MGTHLKASVSSGWLQQVGKPIVPWAVEQAGRSAVIHILRGLHQAPWKSFKLGGPWELKFTRLNSATVVADQVPIGNPNGASVMFFPDDCCNEQNLSVPAGQLVLECCMCPFVT
jgi:hypothetical protein